MPPDVGHRKHNVFGKGAGAIHYDAKCVSTEMTPSGETVAASSTDDMAFPADNVARLEISNIRADINDLTDELVSDNERGLDCGTGPVVPFVNVQIRSTYPGEQNADLHIVDAHLRLDNVLEPQPTDRMAFH